MDIKILTPEEIQTLQVDAALRLLGENANALVKLNNEIGQVLLEKGNLEIRFQQLKHTKQTIIEMNRCLKAISQGA